MIDELVIIGRPGKVGGADTELFDQLKVWLQLGIKCRIIPTSEAKYPINYNHPNLFIEEIKRYSVCNNRHVISYCNQHFLKDIDTIKSQHPKSLSWASCMCFNFKEEIEAHKKGLIDFFLYQTKHQYQQCGVRLLNANSNYNPVHIIPYFDSSEFPFIDERKEIHYGRISRASIDKYAKNQWQIYELTDVKDVQGIVLGWSDELESKFDNWVQKHMKEKGYIQFLSEGSITSQEFYKQCGIVCMSTNTFENLPRVGFEAMASGSVLVVDNRGGWKLQVDHGKTGYLCNDESEFISHLEELIVRPDIRSKLAKNARAKLDAEFSFESSASSWINFFKKLT